MDERNQYTPTVYVHYTQTSYMLQDNYTLKEPKNDKTNPSGYCIYLTIQIYNSLILSNYHIVQQHVLINLYRKLSLQTMRSP